MVQQQLRLDPFSGAVFMLRAKRADRVKLLVWDGSGLTLIYKRLDQARFRLAADRGRGGCGCRRASSARCSSGSTGSGCTAGGWPGRSSRNDPVDPQAYLASTLTRLIHRDPGGQIDQLMPWAYDQVP